MSKMTPEQIKNAFEFRQAKRKGNWDDAPQDTSTHSEVAAENSRTTREVATTAAAVAVEAAVTTSVPPVQAEQEVSETAPPLRPRSLFGVQPSHAEEVVSDAISNRSATAYDVPAGSGDTEPPERRGLEEVPAEALQPYQDVSLTVPTGISDKIGLGRRNIQAVNKDTLPTRPRPAVPIPPAHPFDGYQPPQEQAESTPMLSLPGGMELKPIVGDGMPEPLRWDPPQEK